MRNRFFSIIGLIMLVIILQAQTPLWESVSKDQMAKVFEQVNHWFKTSSNYSVTVTHASYENYNTKVPFEKSTGYFKKENECYHSFLLGIHTIQNANCKIVIDTLNQSMMITNIDNSIWSSYTIDDYKYTLKACKSIEVMKINNDKKYKLEYSEGYPLEKYEFLIGADGTIKEVVWFYSKKVPKNIDDENSEKVKPRLSITFSSYKKNVAGSVKQECAESKYIIKKGNKMFPSDKYKNYSLSDQRLAFNQ